MIQYNIGDQVIFIGHSTCFMEYYGEKATIIDVRFFSVQNDTENAVKKEYFIEFNRNKLRLYVRPGDLMLAVSELNTDKLYEKAVSAFSHYANYSAFYKSDKAKFTPKRIIYNDPATIVFWKDGTKTVVKKSPGEEYCEYNAFCAALAKKIFETNSMVNKIVKSGVDQKKKKMAQKMNTEFKKIKAEKEPDTKTVLDDSMIKMAHEMNDKFKKFKKKLERIMNDDE